MPSAAADTALLEAISRLETALLSPPVAGELEAWCQNCRTAVDEVAAQLPSFYQTVLHRQYAEISQSDPELLPKVEQMIAQDQRQLAELAALRRRLATFAKAAALIKKAVS